jgi:hypothetical protein
MVGYDDIASAPIDVLSAIVGEKDAPEAIAQGVLDISGFPAAGEERLIEIPLTRPDEKKIIGNCILAVRG